MSASGDPHRSGTVPGFATSMRELLRRRAPAGVVVAAMVLAVSVAILLLARPIYRAEARLKIGEPPPTAGVSPTGGLLSFLRLGGDPFANDLELLSSRTLAEGVVRDAALSVRLEAPRGWYRDSLFTSVSLSAVDTTAKAVFEARWVDAHTVAVRRLSPRSTDVGTFAVGAPADFGGVEVVFQPRRPDGPGSVRLHTTPLDEAVRAASSGLKVTRTRREANVLQIRYSRGDPGVARAVVQSAVGRFMAMRVRLFERESGETVDSLRTVAESTRRDLRLAEDSLEATQRASGLVAPDAQSKALVEAYAKVTVALAEARAERDLMDAQQRRVARAPDEITAWSTLVAHPRFLENDNVGLLLQRLTELTERRTELLAQRQPGSPEVRTLDTQIAQLRESMDALVTEYRTSLAGSIDELTHRVADMDALLARVPARTVELGRRERSVRILSEVLVLTEQRLREEELRQALAFSNVQVVDPPALRYRPVWPRRKLGLAVAMVLAVGAGALAVVVGERADTSLRKAAAIREITGAPLLATPLFAGSAPDADELEAIRRATGGACVMVSCPGSGDDATAVAMSLVPVLGENVPVTIESYARAAALAARRVPALLVVRIGATAAAELARTVELLRQAGVDTAGTVAVCGSLRDRGTLWT
jgi:uncharacterized protein involved in exopolysaccharide biosynthesis